MLGLTRFERKDQPLAPRRVFLARVGANVLATLGVVAGSLAIGTAGYHYLGELPWIDGFLNAAMILTGMGPVDPMRTPAGKLFAAGYALYSGIAVLTMVAVLLAPLYHRFIHHFHLTTEADADRAAGRPRR